MLATYGRKLLAGNRQNGDRRETEKKLATFLTTPLTTGYRHFNDDPFSTAFVLYQRQ